MASPCFERDLASLEDSKGMFQFPSKTGNLAGITVSRSGNIFVTDNQNARIYIFDSQRECKGFFGQKGKEDDQLNYPRGLAMTRDGYLLVANEYGVLVFDESGTFITKFGKGELKAAWNVATHPFDGRIYVTDQHHHTVRVYSPDYQLQQVLISEGLREPTGIAVTREGLVYVANLGSKNVKVFTDDGQYLMEFAKGIHPYDVMIPPSGNVLAADIDHNRVVMYNMNGKRLKELETPSGPFSLAADNNGDLLITCYYDKSVRIY